MEQKFYICKHCGNIIAKVKDAGVPVVCCGEPMSEIVPGTTDAAVEKHVPVWTVENGIVHVKVGSVEHPMLPEHYIEWVSLQTKQGNQRKELHPGEKPEVCFDNRKSGPSMRLVRPSYLLRILDTLARSRSFLHGFVKYSSAPNWNACSSSFT